MSSGEGTGRRRGRTNKVVAALKAEEVNGVSVQSNPGTTTETYVLGAVDLAVVDAAVRKHIHRNVGGIETVTWKGQQAIRVEWLS